MVKIFVKITDALAQPLEDAFCELEQSNWGIEKIDDRRPPELFGYFDSEDEAKTAYAELRKKFDVLDESYSLENVDDNDWQNEYKKYLKPWKYRDLNWVPEWMRGQFAEPAGEKTLYFDAGLAFGTGDHPTTRLCAMSMLDYLSHNDPRDKFLVDAGCGSGILSLTAKRYGFGRVYGFDIDAEAIRICGENARANSVPLDNVSFECAGIETALCEKKADIVLANIISDVLCVYADILLGAVKKGGLLVLSGILATENARVRDYFLSRGGDMIESAESQEYGEWSRIEIKIRK